MIKVILFDIDNTILDFEGYVVESLKSGFKEFNICEFNDEVLKTFHTVNNKLWRDLEKNIIDFNELKRIRFNKVFEALGVSFDGEYFEKYFRDKLNTSAILMPNAFKVVCGLSEKYILCVASNGPYDQQCQRLKISGLYDYFTDYFMSEEIGYSKPSSMFFEVSINRLERKLNKKFNKDEILIVGDSLTSDILGGINYNIKSCFYNKNNKDYSGYNVDYVINDLIELLDILK